MYQRNTWTQLSLINDPVVISLQNTKVYVCSDSVLCLGKVFQNPECNEALKNRVAGVRVERNYSDFDDVKGESAEFEWNIFPGFTTLQLCDKISNLLSSLGQSPETFTGRILFMSMFNDISCDDKDNKEQCLKDANYVKTFAKRFGIGQWSFIGPGSGKKWYPSETARKEPWMARGMGSPRQVPNRRRRTREGPEPACVQTPLLRGGTCRGGRDELTSCRGTV